jgi:hypothetical protein
MMPNMNTVALAQDVVVVSGLPRSGTSMMMKMLGAGGIPVMIDNERVADEDNPNGYFEFEQVKKIKSDISWLDDARGKVVKMVYLLLYDLPAEYRYRVVFMRRNLNEVLASQKKMLARQNKATDMVDDATMLRLFQRDLAKVEKWLAERPNFEVLYVDYNQMLSEPANVVGSINEFLDGQLDLDAMAVVVDPTLYRNRR